MDDKSVVFAIKHNGDAALGRYKLIVLHSMKESWYVYLTEIRKYPSLKGSVVWHKVLLVIKLPCNHILYIQSHDIV